MDQFTYPIREVLRNKKIKQEDLARTLGRTRQTVSRYIAEYERTGKVGDPRAQEEFDRLVAEERQRLLDIQDADQRIGLARSGREGLDSADNELRGRYEALLRDLMTKHPDVEVIDWGGRPVTLEALDLKKKSMWVNYGQNRKLVEVITDSERESWLQITKEHGEIRDAREDYENTEKSSLLEKLWDSTNPRGKPIIYDDTFDCLPAKAAGFEQYNFSCRTFCLCSGSTARIYADGIWTQRFEHDLKMNVYANIYVLCDRDYVLTESVKLEPRMTVDGEYEGQTDDLIPGYKYVYTLVITADGSDEGLSDKERTMKMGYSGWTYPLK